ncbi:hypothetical protein FHETE_1461 [Fusarium heterosporum]|uniref:Monooxygenase n=1 Tax=Fusarium heterosporum TaxID=42747 RepID=A0A8H5WZM1_FUSHE|nr:hypothetical protein FHETE_1461 [Fusarium heterosporum]
MKNAEFRPKLEPTSKPLTYPSTSGAAFMLLDCFKPQSIVVLGSFVQLALCAFLPMRWAVIPPAAVLLNSVITTLIQLRSTTPNEYMQGAIPGRTTAQLPFSSGSFGSKPAANSVVVLHLGIQVNHPLGLAAPGMDRMAKFFADMQEELATRRDEYGMLGMSTWRGDERGSNNTLLNIFYFRDLEGVHRFAHGDVHRRGWDYYNKAKHSHLGVFHETYSVPAREYENVYVNCRPVMMGRASVRTTPVGEEERWTNTLVSADTPALKTHYARMARDEQGNMKEMD